MIGMRQKAPSNDMQRAIVKNKNPRSALGWLILNATFEGPLMVENNRPAALSESTPSPPV
jgi:hypothetical protein